MYDIGRRKWPIHPRSETSYNQESDLITRARSPEVYNSVAVKYISKEKDVVSEIGKGYTFDANKP